MCLNGKATDAAVHRDSTLFVPSHKGLIRVVKVEVAFRTLILHGCERCDLMAITQQIGLQMNDTKTKYMLNRQVGNRVKEIELMGKKYEKVESFKYLGAMITSLNDI